MPSIDTGRRRVNTPCFSVDFWHIRRGIADFPRETFVGSQSGKKVGIASPTGQLVQLTRQASPATTTRKQQKGSRRTF